MKHTLDYDCTCGPWCEPFWEDADGVFECRFCGADWGTDTGLDEPWHHEWCVHGVAAQIDGRVSESPTHTSPEGTS
jgi:hypothetical protein